MDIDKSLEDLIIFKQYGITGYSNALEDLENIEKGCTIKKKEQLWNGEMYQDMKDTQSQ